MPAVITCPKCKTKFKLPDKLIGKAIKCSSCGTAFKTKARRRQARRRQAIPNLQPRNLPSWVWTGHFGVSLMSLPASHRQSAVPRLVGEPGRRPRICRRRRLSRERPRGKKGPSMICLKFLKTLICHLRQQEREARENSKAIRIISTDLSSCGRCSFRSGSRFIVC